MSVISLTDYKPMPRYDGQAWAVARIEGAPEQSGPWAQVEAFPLDPIDDDPSQPQTRNFTVAYDDATVEWLRLVWVDQSGNQDATLPIDTECCATGALAEVSDVEIRLGRDLTERQTAQADALLRQATTNIYNAADKDASWQPPAEIEPLLSMLAVELACRAMANPQALGQISESLGAYSSTTTYPRELPGSGIMLTEVEELMIRRAVWGQNAGTYRPDTDASDYMLIKGYDTALIPITVGTGGDGGDGDIVYVEGPPGPPGPAGPTGPQGDPGPLSMSGTAEYTFNTNTVTPPANGQLRFDAVAYADVRHVYLADMTADGIDTTTYIDSVADPQVLYIQDKDDSTKFVSFNVGARATMFSGYAAFDVALRASGAPLTAQRLVVTLVGLV